MTRGSIRAKRTTDWANVAPLKLCRDCLEEKPLDNFRKRNGGRKGWISYCNPCFNIRARRWKQENPEKAAARFREATLRRYNLTPADYDAMLAAQGGVCAICKTSEPGGKGRFRVDHDHACCPERMRSCGKCIRGLLCNYCNLHLAGENPRRLRAALAYLENFRHRSAVQGGPGVGGLQTLPWCNEQ